MQDLRTLETLVALQPKPPRGGNFTQFHLFNVSCIVLLNKIVSVLVTFFCVCVCVFFYGRTGYLVVWRD